LRADRDVVTAAVHQNGSALEWASDELRDDRDVVLVAATNPATDDLLQHTSNRLRGDHEIVLAAVGCRGRELELASEELRNNRDVVLAAVGNDGSALGYASDDLKNDKEIVLAAVAHGGEDGEVFGDASEELRSNREFVLEVIDRNAHALCYASEELQNDPSVVLKARECAEPYEVYNPHWRERYNPHWSDFCGDILFERVEKAFEALEDGDMTTDIDLILLLRRRIVHGNNTLEDDFKKLIGDYAKGLQRDLCEKIWLVLDQWPCITSRPYCFPSGMRLKILELAGVQQEYEKSNEIIQLLPILWYAQYEGLERTDFHDDHEYEW